MRDIKFRAWDGNKNTMHNNITISRLHLYDFDGDNITEQEPLKIMQYTGLKDKNGKEIYEGDILDTDLERPYLVVEFRNGCFVIECCDDEEIYYDIMFPLEKEISNLEYHKVIGNIYENPYLL